MVSENKTEYKIVYICFFLMHRQKPERVKMHICINVI